jgi:hypothetical protein
MYYLIVPEGGREYVLCSGRRPELEALARQLRAEKLFRYVRVDSRTPPDPGKHPPPGSERRAADAGGTGPAPDVTPPAGDRSMGCRWVVLPG